MGKTFKFTVETKDIHDVGELWRLINEIENATHLVCHWTITSSFPGLYRVEGRVLN